MSFIPEDRLGMGLAPSFSVTDNVMLKTYGESRFHIKKLEIKDTDKKFKKTSKKVLNSISGFINKLPCAFVDRATARKGETTRRKTRNRNSVYGNSRKKTFGR